MSGTELRIEAVAAKKYPALIAGIRFSSAALSRLRDALGSGLRLMAEDTPCIAVCGSLARLEASAESDLDFMIIYPRDVPKERRLGFRDKVNEIISQVKMPLDVTDRTFDRPNPKGVFAGDAFGPEIYGRIGSKEEDYSNIARRMLILLECQWLWNQGYFDSLRTELISRYGSDVAADPTKNLVLLINDLIRYFRSICVNYHDQMASEYGKWPIRNLKLRHSRVLMYSSLLFALGELSKYEYSSDAKKKLSTLRQYIEWPALERYVRLYEANKDDNIFRLLGLYAFFLSRLSDNRAREALKDLEYNDRYTLPEFSALKSNSDAFMSELSRFVHARRGVWSDRFFEYLLF